MSTLMVPSWALKVVLTRQEHYYAVQCLYDNLRREYDFWVKETENSRDKIFMTLSEWEVKDLPLMWEIQSEIKEGKDLPLMWEIQSEIKEGKFNNDLYSKLVVLTESLINRILRNE